MNLPLFDPPPAERAFNRDALAALFLDPLRPHASRLAVLLFEFGARGAGLREFVAALDPFLAHLPEGFRYAAEEERRAAYIFVNNRLKGNAPETIRAVVGE